MSKFSRRSFLKMMGAVTPAFLLPGLSVWVEQNFVRQDPSLPNIIFLVFDAMSARNLSVYGYPRETTPNFQRFAEHATVYHQHHSGGNYTIPGTASLLTGTYPWTHRAINHSGVVKRDLVEHNIFQALGGEYQRLAFPQNTWADFIVSQFEKDIETILPSNTFGELDYLLSSHFPKDKNLSVRALEDFVFKTGTTPVSLIFGSLLNIAYGRKSAMLDTSGYPKGTAGLPHNADYPLYYRLETLIAGIASLILDQPAPFFNYFHVLPPHAPYRPNIKFNNAFVDDKYTPVDKPLHRFTEQVSRQKLNASRRQYDQYIASIDDEFGGFLDALKDAGVLENSYVVVTSDHGEMFERGEKGHSTPLLYEPVTHIPLLISAPGQHTRQDIYAPTSAVDLLPTFVKLTGKPIPSWCEGRPLPGVGGDEDMERAIYTVEAKLSPAFGPLGKSTVALQKGNYKLIYYKGYEAEDTFELFDLSEDTEELNDLYPQNPVFAKQMRDELLEAFSAANKPYIRQ